MAQSENSTSNSKDKVLSEKELRAILKKPPNEFIKEEYGERSILIDGYTIEDERLILDDSVTVNLPLTFHGCTIKSDKLFFISGLTCNESLTFEGCTISDCIYFDSGNFKDVIIKHVHVKSIHLTGCTFGKVSISGYDIDDIWVSGAKFESLHIGEHLVGDNISKLVIFAREDETGDIIVSEQSFDEISLYGINKGKRISFAKLKCNNISITDFKNEGILNFYGIEPKDPNSDTRYFQIVNSNLDKAEFYRALFSQYKELIVIDSFITDALFIGCKWSNNVRALFGPGYGTFEDSLKSGRKTTPSEIVAIKEAYRQLKISMSKHSDKIQEHKFYSEELNFHSRTLTWGKPWENQFWDKMILLWSKTFSDYGQSFIKPLFWLLFGHYILFVLALLCNGFNPLHISLCEPTAAGFKEAFEKFFIYINPLRRLETSLSGYLILLDLLMRIWSSYMIYNLIRASRRFIS
ncbi:hypothetical protein [Chitinophaga sp. OAE865]|uniref:hypothetical protein n=1 Tax=Chitinophaga sp. OAE865 TaxID=2817898 RepID=UPI001AE1D0E9